MKTLMMMLAVLAMVFVGCKEKSTVTSETGGKLTVTAPGDVNIEGGGTAEITVKITRDKMAGPVAISFAKLPDGVEAIGTDVKLEENEGAFVLKASPTAALVKDNVSDVTATGPEGVAATVTFKITVVEK